MTNVVGDLVMDALRELANRSYQERVWLGQGDAEVSSFVECVERLFSDSGLGYALDRGEAVFSDTIDAKLRDLRARLGKIDGARPPTDVVNDPAMDLVRSLAEDTIAELLETPDA